jgi:lipopolysaccharide export system protein LptC
MIAANQGRYDLDTQQMAVSGPVGSRARRLPARNPRRAGRLEAAAARQLRPGRGPMRLGQFQAGQLRADLGERKVCSMAVLA